MTPTLDVDDVAFLMKVHRQTVLDLIRDGALPAARIGRAYVLMSSDVLAYIEDAIFEQTEARLRKPFPVPIKQPSGPTWTQNAVLHMTSRKKATTKSAAGSNPPKGFEPSIPKMQATTSNPESGEGPSDE